MFEKMGLRSAAAVVAALAFGATASTAQAQDVAGVNVTAKAPTSVTVNVTGMRVTAVRQVVRVAANTVCRNAALNYEIDVFDTDWCSSHTIDRTMARYRQAHAGSQVAMGPQVLTIASR